MAFRAYRSKPNFTRFRQTNFSKSPAKTKQFDPSTFVTQNFSTQSVTTPDIVTGTFSQMSLHPQLQQNISARGFTNLTPIQAKVIPLILLGKDVVGQANTGTGKTAAFLIPLIQENLNFSGKNVLIIAPTRELAVQINREFQQLTIGTSLRSAVCIGGVGQYPQAAMLRRRPQFVIGTPGRLLDFSRQHLLKLNLFNAVVLDEVDQMLDMGFINDIKQLLQNLAVPRQTLFFSATIPDSSKPVIHQFLNTPEYVSVAKQPVVAAVKQRVIEIKDRPKIDVLHELLITAEFRKVLVFFRTKHGTNHVARRLSERGLSVVAIHGNKSQSQRQTALRLFQTEQVRVLLATDIASRGLDIKDVSHVINYDLPATKEDYIHRIGRTARADKGGQAVTLV